MHKWKIDILLKDGTKLVGICNCDAVDSIDVVKRLLGENTKNDWFTILNRHETASLVVNTSEISAMEIIPAGVK